ncbi:TetR/AcrR family transcriptional regulator [Elizabethkingia meningoseptica]|uniref:TetR/AcrR family transcriptional regulator n=1 Tax=Elizabethkingia meningoseptica TaxID=238 RepID=UPI003892A065
MNKAEKTKLFIIEKTASIFNTKGYAATSLSDITEATGLTKGSVYGNFSSKDEVVTEAFKYNTAKLYKGFESAMSGMENASERLMAFIEFYRNNWKKIYSTGGCPMLNAATEADNHLLFLKKTVKQYFIIWQKRISRIIEEGKEEGIFRADTDAEKYAYTIMILIEGGVLLAGTLDNADHLDIALDRALKIIDEEIKI